MNSQSILLYGVNQRRSHQYHTESSTTQPLLPLALKALSSKYTQSSAEAPFDTVDHRFIITGSVVLSAFSLSSEVHQESIAIIYVSTM